MKARRLNNTQKHNPDAYEPVRRDTALRAIDLAREYLVRPEVEQLLGRFAGQLLEVADMAEVPTILSRRLQPSPGYQERDIFPFVVMRAGETIDNPMTEPTPLQLQAFARLAAEIAPHDKLESHIGYTTRPTMSPQDAGATWGIGWHRQHLLRKELLIAVRPLVGVRPMSFRNMALTSIHEFSHAYDFLTQPLTNKNRSELDLESELKAHTIRHRVERLTSPDGGFDNAISARVAALRQYYNGMLEGEDAFRTGDDIQEALIRDGLRFIW